MIKRQCLDERLADGLLLAPEEPQGAAAGLAENARGEAENLPRSNGAAAATAEGQKGQEQQQQQEEEDGDGDGDRPPFSGPLAVVKSALSGAAQQKMREAAAAAAAYVKPNGRGLAMRGGGRSSSSRRTVGSGSGVLPFFARRPLGPAAPVR